MEKESFMDVDLERDDIKNVKLSKSDRNIEGKRLIKKGPSSKDADASGNNFPRENEKCDLRRTDSELDLSNCQRYACSYCFLPKNYPVPPASGMTELGASVLNVHLVSVTFGSENCPFKFTRRNKYEDCLNRCEDDRFELDMWLEIATLTVKRVEELLEKIHSHKIEPEINIRIEDHFTSQDLRCLEQLYGDYGLHVVDILHENVSASLPVILTRLKQKLEEGLRMRADLQNDWAEVFVKNHSRALDHRRFYFNQQDPKTLSFKALLAECKLLNEKMDENNHFKSAAGNGHIISNMVFEYTDTDIHDVLYKIIALSSVENCTSKDELDKIMKVWTTFVEPMFGVFSRLQDTEINKETMKHGYKGSVSSSWQSHGAPCARGFSTHLKSGYLFNPSVPQLGKENLKNFENRKSIAHRTCGEQLEIFDEVYQYNELAAICNCEDGREDGELSPEVHFEENSFLDLEGTVIDKVEVKDGPEGKQYQVCPGESMCDVEAEAKTKVDDVDAVNDGDESSSRHLRNSPNLSETVVDASNNQCDDVGYDVQESSHEHDGEEEGIDHDTKSDEMSVLDIFEGICHPKMTKPLTERAPRVLHYKDGRSRIFYGNTSFYLLFRFHQILYERILSAKTNSSAAEIQLRTLKNTGIPSFYAKFKESLYRFLNHSIDKSKFEDDCYTFVGPQSYLLSTLNILISKLVKQLQAVASNEMDNRFFQLYAYENSRGPGRFSDLVYLQNACVIHDGDIFRFECSLNPTRLSIQLVEHACKESDSTNISPGSDFADYLYNGFLKSVPDIKEMSNVFLRRNMRKCNCDDEHSATCEAMSKIQMINGLQCRMLSSSQVLYVLGTEDFLFRRWKNRKLSDGIGSLTHVPGKSRGRLRRFLSKCLDQ
ncbi:unnamed protein product [Musa acuminata var. zebrina]